MNSGTITNEFPEEINNGGSIANNGKITNTSGGKITNDIDGTIINTYQASTTHPKGIIENSGTITNDGTIECTDEGKITGNKITGTGTCENCGKFCPGSKPKPKKKNIIGHLIMQLDVKENVITNI